MGRRLIDADKLIELIDDDIASLDKNMSREGYDVCLCTLRMVKQYIKVLPTAEPTKHGRWIDCGTAIDGDTEVKCSECGEVLYWLANYCPNCGAKMDEVENGKTY